MNKLKTYLIVYKYAIYIPIWRFYLSFFRWFISKNKVCAHVGQIVCTRYDLKRHKGQLATVIKAGYLEYELDGKVHKERNATCVTLDFWNNIIAWNFTPDEYYILKCRNFRHGRLIEKLYIKNNRKLK